MYCRLMQWTLIWIKLFTFGRIGTSFLILLLIWALKLHFFIIITLIAYQREYKENKNNEIQETKMQKQSKEEYAICLKSVIAGVQCGQCKTWYRYRGEGTAKNANWERVS